MEHSEFWNLYDNGKLENLKVWRREENIDTEGDFECNGFNSEILSFTYNGKFYLRLVMFAGYEVRWVGRRNHRTPKRDGVRVNSWIKEFDNRNQANAYFKKVAVGFSKV